MTGGTPRIPVVLAPDLVLAGLFDPSAREVLNAWRDSKIAPIISRDLLVMYLRALRKAGVTPALLQLWATWFNSVENTIFIDSLPEKTTAEALCDSLASLGQAKAIICFHQLAAPNPLWKTAKEWMHQASPAKA